MHVSRPNLQHKDRNVCLGVLRRRLRVFSHLLWRQHRSTAAAPRADNLVLLPLLLPLQGWRPPRHGRAHGAPCGAPAGCSGPAALYGGAPAALYRASAGPAVLLPRMRRGKGGQVLQRVRSWPPPAPPPLSGGSSSPEIQNRSSGILHLGGCCITGTYAGVYAAVLALKMI
jgi:hypothetical protein